MQIYLAEQDLATQILNNQSLAYVSRAVPEDPQVAIAMVENTESPSTPDLFYLKSILVSVGWNKNDDVFLAEHVWAARKTPVDKPTNTDHTEEDIIGHIISTWAMNSDGEEIPDSTEEKDLPSVFHIGNSAVIYRHWRKKEKRKIINQLIAEIMEGKKFVSMECFFNDFDYAVEKDGKIDIVPRSDKTAFLTKHLRAYGGSGTYEGYKIGRVIKEILFSGKGYVDNPANENSIILDYSNKSDSSFGVYVLCNTLEEMMSADNDKVIAELQAKVEELSKANEGLQAQVAKVNRDNLEETVKGLQEELSVADASINALKRSESNLVDKCKALSEQLVTATDELNTIKASKIVGDRINAFVKLGFSEDEAKTEVAALGNMSDASFHKVVDLIASRPVVKVEASSNNVTNGNEVDPAESEIEGAVATENVATAGVNTVEKTESLNDDTFQCFASFIEKELNKLEKKHGAETVA